MPWLRVDDLFAENAKIIELNDRQFRVHFRALLYAVRNRTSGYLTPKMLANLRVRRPDQARFVELGLWDETASEGTFRVHDFEKYNPIDPELAQRFHSPNGSGGPSRARAGTGARPLPEPQPQEQEPKRSLPASRSETSGAEGLPFSLELLTLEALASISDPKKREASRKTIVANAKGLPEASIVKVRESLASAKPRNPAGYVVKALKSEAKERAAA
jgi:hypothetical protein